MDDGQRLARRRAWLRAGIDLGVGMGALAITGGCGQRRGAALDERVAPPRRAESDRREEALTFAGGTTQAEADARIGTIAPAWDVPFVGGEGPTLASLRGRVTLLRFWTDTCPFCRATAPALAAIDAEYRDRGVSVVGMFHPKPKGSSRTEAEVAAVAERYGFRFPIGLDLSWAVLDDYWMSLPGRRYTSVAFVIDKRSVIRFVHGGPEFHPGGAPDHARCRDDHAAVVAALDKWLAA